MVHVLRSAPVYRDAGRLDAWESAFAAAADPDEGTCASVDPLLDRIFQFGRHNLYTVFDEAGTWEQFVDLARRFQEQGIPTPQVLELSGW